MFKVVLVAIVATIALAQEPIDEPEVLIPEIYVAVPEETGAEEELVRVRRGFSGGRFGLPGGGSNLQLGYSGSIYSRPRLDSINPPSHDVSGWGQLSQSSNRRGMTGPIMYSGGANWVQDGSRGLSLSGSHVPRVGSQATLAGHSTVFSNDNHRLTAGLQHTKTFDPKFREVGSGSSTGSLTYDHRSGASLDVSGTRTPGLPDSASVSSSVPVATFAGGHGQLSVGTQSTFAHGHKPDHQVGAQLTITP